MYSSLKNVQILVALLKKRNIKHIVCSAGNSHNAILRSLEEDDFFQTYSIVDERSAAFFACGLIQELKEPVAICCTAGTAATNFLSGVTEASRRELPLVVITADKNPYYLAQYEDQMIEQVSMFKPVTKYTCSLPIVKDWMDEWYCGRVVNEAILEMTHHGTGPVQINVVIEQGMMAVGEHFKCEALPDVNIIERYDLKGDKSRIGTVLRSLAGKKVMLICGQEFSRAPECGELISEVYKKYNCIFVVDKITNLHGEGTIDIARASRINVGIPENLRPDVVISLGGNTTVDLKFKMKNPKVKFEHWVVNEMGRVADPFKKLNNVFEGTTKEFLECMLEYGPDNTDNTYFNEWEKENDKFAIPEFEFSNLYCIKNTMENIPPESVLHIGNSTIIRISQYFDVDDTVKVYCNRGVNGIDGCVSSFIGQSAATDKLCFLLVGDLTFFYDMNALWNRYVGNNVRILLNNNSGAALFHFNQGLGAYPTLNENVAAEHHATAEGWAKSLGIKYLSATTKAEFDSNLVEFTSKDEAGPMLFEVFTDKETDAKLQHDFYDMNLNIVEDKTIKKSIKKTIKSFIRR